MATDSIRLSQAVGMFGPGAMLDLPDRSVLVLGLDHWEMLGAGTFKVIQEPRLARLLHERLSDANDGRIIGDRPPELRTPPLDPGDPRRIAPAIKATVFPRWFVCDAIAGDPPNRRRLVPFSNLEPPKRLDYKGEDGKKRRASPIRFVCGCEKGHLQDIEWRRVLHSVRTTAERSEDTRTCREPMWLEDGGTSADPRDTRIVCDCGAAISLEQLFIQGRLGPCQGERPWIGDRDPNQCDAPKGLRLLIRSATNTYFPQVASVISLPQTEDMLARRIEEHWSILGECTSVDDVKNARKFNPAVRASLEGFSDEEIFARLQRARPGSAAKAGDVEDPRHAEFEILASGQTLIGENVPLSNLHAETLSRERWDPENDPFLKGIDSLVAVHRLREVSCLYGFTRFEPSPLASEDVEDVGLAIEGAPLGTHPDWLPAIEQFGEGFFIRLSPSALNAWLARSEVQARASSLHAGAAAWIAAKRQRGLNMSANATRERERPEYIMAHSLAHTLMSEVAIDCGYPSSALKERIYVLPTAPGEPLKCAVLIYTATAGAQGTLGGLVETTSRFAPILRRALERLYLCSGDPVCADHESATADEDRMLHGAACHGCLLISETSCEARNLFLDRALLVSSVATEGAGFFGG